MLLASFQPHRHIFFCYTFFFSELSSNHHTPSPLNHLPPLQLPSNQHHFEPQVRSFSVVRQAVWPQPVHQTGANRGTARRSERFRSGWGGGERAHGGGFLRVQQRGGLPRGPGRVRDFDHEPQRGARSVLGTNFLFHARRYWQMNLHGWAGVSMRPTLVLICDFQVWLYFLFGMKRQT